MRCRNVLAFSLAVSVILSSVGCAGKPEQSIASPESEMYSDIDPETGTGYDLSGMTSSELESLAESAKENGEGKKPGVYEVLESYTSSEGFTITVERNETTGETVTVVYGKEEEIGGSTGTVLPSGSGNGAESKSTEDIISEELSKKESEKAEETGTSASEKTTTQATKTTAPTVAPTQPVTQSTTAASTQTPTAAPTQAPTTAPTAAPTQAPTAAPTAAPTQAPTAAPTVAPTQAPTEAPTTAPQVVAENPEEQSYLDAFGPEVLLRLKSFIITDLGQARSEILRGFNAGRAEMGWSAVVLDESYNATAQAHAQHMADAGRQFHHNKCDLCPEDLFCIESAGMMTEIDEIYQVESEYLFLAGMLHFDHAYGGSHHSGPLKIGIGYVRIPSTGMVYIVVQGDDIE